MSVSKDQLQNEAEIQTDDETPKDPSENRPEIGLALVPQLAEDSNTAEPLTPRKTSLQKPIDSWQIVAVKPRVDSSNQSELISEVRGLIAQGHRFVAINLKDNRFLSLPVIKYCVDAARELWPVGGDFVLLACPEKTKRHFEIYGTLAHIRILRSIKELRSLASTPNTSPERGNESVI
jgi:anti-anti-sigma regulatory factor